MSLRKAVLNVVICMLLFSVGYLWYFYAIFFGGVGYKGLVLKALMFVASIVFALESVRYAGEGEFCIAAVLDIWALMLLMGAIYGL